MDAFKKYNFYDVEMHSEKPTQICPNRQQIKHNFETRVSYATRIENVAI